MLRFSDLDIAGHVNNAVFSTLFESARCELLLDGNNWIEPHGMGFVMRRIEVDFLKSIRYPETRSVQIGTAVTAIGDSSMTFQQALFVEEECCAVAQAVMVLISSKGKERIPEHVRSMLAQKAPALTS